MQDGKRRTAAYGRSATHAAVRPTLILGRTMRALLALSLALSVIAFAPPKALEPAFAAGATYYVAKTGSDTTGTGSATNPWLTVQKAVNSAGSGDTVRVAAGTYNERVTIPTTKSGTSATTTKLIADGRVILSRGLVVQSNYTEVTGFEITPGWEGASVDYHGHVTIDGSYNTLSNITVRDIAYTGTGISFGFNAAYNTVNGFKISNVKHYGAFFIAWWDSPKGAGAHHNVLKNGTISNFGGNAGVNMAGANNTLDGVEISGPSGWNNYADGDGIRFIGPNMTVRNSKVRILQQNNPVGTNQPHTDQMQFWKFADGLLIENSIIGSTEPGLYDSQKGSCLMAEVRAGDSITFTIRNSIFLNTDRAAYGGGLTSTGAGYLKGNFINSVFWTPGVDVPSGSFLRNNVFKQFKTESISQPIDSDYNVFITGSTRNTNEGPNTITVSDPGFVNPDITATTRWGVDADWRPKSTSVLVDRGIAAYAPALDMAGVKRDTRPDVGALEYVAAVAPPADTTAPTVSVTSPTNGATVSGTVALGASASDNVGVTKVEFRVNGNLVGTDTSAPYTGVWDASAAAAGSHTIQARAYDAAGNVNNASVSVNVPAPADTTAPTVGITTPSNGATVSGSVPLGATASDNVGVSKVEFRVDGILVGTDTSSPYTAVWDASKATVGTHTIQARAYDAAGNTSNASISVNIADTTAPVTTATLDRSPGTSGWYQSAPSITLTANETASTYYKWDDPAGTWYNYTGPVKALEGAHTLYFRSIDAAGNTEVTRALNINVDSTAPTAPVLVASAGTSAISLAWTPAADAVTTRVLRSTTGFAVSPTDASAIVVYDGTANVASDGVVQAGTTYYYTAFSRDAAGNWSQAATATAALDGVSIDLSASATSVKPLRWVTLKGKHSASGLVGESKAPVTVWALSRDTWQEVGTATYNATEKRYEFKMRVRSTATYRMQCAEDPTKPNLSNTVTVTVVK